MQYRVVDELFDSTECDSLISHFKRNMDEGDLDVCGYMWHPGDLPIDISRIYRPKRTIPPTSFSRYRLYRHGHKGHPLHVDCCISMGAYDDEEILLTTVIYLNDVDGGSTEFPEHDISILPKRGRLLQWTNFTDDGDIDNTSEHLSTDTPSDRYILLHFYVDKPTPGNIDLVKQICRG